MIVVRLFPQPTVALADRRSSAALAVLQTANFPHSASRAAYVSLQPSAYAKYVGKSTTCPEHIEAGLPRGCSLHGSTAERSVSAGDLALS